tara:strand:- start:2158 stop:3792 length:1635 start_codon:yes stop_codon:yes gene_type:complete
MNSYIDKANQSLSQHVPSKKTMAERNNHLVLEQSRIGRQTNNLTMLQEKADSSAKVGQSLQLQASADTYSQTKEILHKKENKTGLPDNLKSGIEKLSGVSMDDVKVHKNSDKPAQLNAHAYAQGTDIHLSAGQEKHLPHEAWHVVQQKQGRVQPTKQLRSKLKINDDAGLEKEADIMGNKALQMKTFSASTNDEFYISNSSSLTQLYANNDIIQREGEGDDFEYDAETEIDLDELVDGTDSEEPISSLGENEDADTSELGKITPENKMTQAQRIKTHLMNSLGVFSQFNNLAKDSGDMQVASGIDLAKDSAARDIGFLEGILPVIKKIAVVPIISTVLNVITLYNVGGSALRKARSKKAFAKLMLSEKEEAANIGVYAYKKVARGLNDAYLLLGAELMGFIGNVSSIVGALAGGVGAIVGAIFKTIEAAMKGFRIVGKLLKGVYKFFRGTKGKNRSANSLKLIEFAGEGDDDAAQAVLDLKPKNLMLDPETNKFAIANMGVAIIYPTNSSETTTAIQILATHKPSQLSQLKNEVTDKMRSTSNN